MARGKIASEKAEWGFCRMILAKNAGRIFGIYDRPIFTITIDYPTVHDVQLVILMTLVRIARSVSGHLVDHPDEEYEAIPGYAPREVDWTCRNEGGRASVAPGATIDLGV
jgi:hypothetical protein